MAVASQLAEPAEPIESTNLTEPAGAAVARRSQRDIDHLRALMQQTPASLTGNAIGIGLMLAMYGGLAAAPALLAAWGLLSIGLWLTRLWHYRRYRRHPDADTGTLTRWRRSWRALVISQGAMWGTASWIFWGLGKAVAAQHMLGFQFSPGIGQVQRIALQQALRQWNAEVHPRHRRHTRQLQGR